MPLANTQHKAPENTNCSVVLCCSEVCVPCRKDKVRIRVLYSDALSRSGAAAGLRVGARLHLCTPQWDSSTEVKRGTMNHKSLSDL